MSTTQIYQGSSMVEKEEIEKSNKLLENKLEPPLFVEEAQPPWMPTEAGKIMSFQSLHDNRITEVKGEVACTKCNATRQWTICISEYTKYEVATFVNRSIAAPYRGTEVAWFNPDLPNCQDCEEECSMAPVLDERQETVDWLFLFLAQMVKFCSLGQLCYYCAMNGIVTPKTKFQAIKQVYRHLLHQFLAN